MFGTSWPRHVTWLCDPIIRDLMGPVTLPHSSSVPASLWIDPHTTTVSVVWGLYWDSGEISCNTHVLQIMQQRLYIINTPMPRVFTSWASPVTSWLILLYMVVEKIQLENNCKTIQIYRYILLLLYSIHMDPRCHSVSYKVRYVYPLCIRELDYTYVLPSHMLYSIVHPRSILNTYEVLSKWHKWRMLVWHVSNFQ